MKKLFNVLTLSTVIIFVLVGCSSSPIVSDSTFSVIYSQNDKFGYKDSDGNIIIKAKYIGAFPFCDNLALVVSKRLNQCENWQYIDINGDSPFKIDCYRADSFSEGYAAVKFKEGGKWGYIDKNGEIVIQPQYDLAAMFENGLATVHIGGISGKWLVIDTEGNIVRETEKAENWKTHVQGTLNE